MTHGPLVLVGPPGSGTSSVARAIVARDGGRVIDTDRIAAETLGHDDVATAFVVAGEERFAAAETEAALAAVADLVPGDVLVLGACVRDAGVQRALASLPVVQLRVSLAHAAPRLGFATARPVFLGNPRSMWSRLVTERQADYDAVATASVDTDDRDVAEVADAVLTTTQEQR